MRRSPSGPRTPPPRLRARLGLGGTVPDLVTIWRVLTAGDPSALDRALGGWVSARLAARRPGGQVVLAVDGKTVRGARTSDGMAPHLLACLDHGTGVVLGQVGAETNEITMFTALLDQAGDLRGVLVTADALHAQREHATWLHEHGAHYLVTVEHASHCSCCLSWRVKQSSLAAFDLDTQAFAASPGEVDGVELAALDLVQHGLAGGTEAGGGLAEGQPAIGCLGPYAVAELLVDADLPGRSEGELLAGDEAIA
jgi:Transposase DDE domain